MERLQHSRPRRGVGIIEALISLLVLALGMMSFAALQARLRLNSDVAKQRAEAVRIGQEDIENFRSFGTFAANGGIANNLAYDSITTGAAQKSVLAAGVTTKTNAAYTVTRTVSDVLAPSLTDAPVKNVRVSVAWVDRTGTAQQVELRSVISRSDPAVAASLALAPNGSPVRDLLGRDIQVPIPAKSLGNGTSVVKPGLGGNVAYVFNNDSGLVTRRCTSTDIGSTVTNLLTTSILDSATCSSISAYLLSGFIRADFSNNPSATSPNEVFPAGSSIAMRLDLKTNAPPYLGGSAGLLNSTNWPAISGATPVTTGYSTPECTSEALKTVRYTTPVNFTQVNNGVTTTVTSTTVIAIIPQSVTSVTSATVAPWVGVSSVNAASQIVNPVDTGERYVGYSCLVYPTDLDSNPNTTAAYTGRLALWPTGWALGNTSSTYKVCRYSADYNLNDGGGNTVYAVDGSNVITRIDNAEHPYAYLNVQRSLSNQNFLVIRGNRGCPTDSGVEVNGQGGENYTNETTVTHQP
jgi:Tfp pilus assembly protein PilV